MYILSKFLILTAVSILFIGCGPQAKQPVLLAPMLSVPNFPNYTKKSIEFDVKFDSDSNLFHNVVQAKPIKKGSSVVINVPESISEKNMQSHTQRNTDDQDFKTKNFFNEAEQQIERELIRRGFNVKSRSKFEAKLRSMRDRTDSVDRNYYWNVYNSVAPEHQSILNELKKKHERNEISARQFADQLKEFQSPITKRRNENEKELTDISEVIRAAEAGAVKADYILQINIFETDNAERATADLNNLAIVRNFVSSKDTLQRQFNNGKNSFTCVSLAAKLNAKLLHVKTGNIVWIGEHSVNEYTASNNKIKAKLSSQRQVTNKSEIRNFINHQNSWYQRKLRYGKHIKYPTFKFDTLLDGPHLVYGKCQTKAYINNKTRASLARKVAQELISTIKVSQ